MVTIKDIARELNLSYSTVSLCLNSSPRVNRATMEKVKETAERLGYARNARARAFVKKQTQLIGIVVPDIANPFFSAITRGAESVAVQRNYHVLILNTDRRSDLESRHIKLISEGQVDGLLITSVHNRSSLMDTILDQGLPVVFVNNPYPHRNANFVGSNGYKTGQLAAEHLLSLGHTRIAVCGVRSETEFHVQLMKGFRRMLSDWDVPWQSEYRFDGEFSVESGYESALRLLGGSANPTAIFAFDDLIALGVMRALEEKGLRIPQDMSVMGCDDVFLASLPRINLTTVRQQTREMGQIAMDILLDRVIDANGDAKTHSVTLPSELVARETTASVTAKR